MHTGVVHAELSWQGRTGSISVDGAVVATVRRALLRERAESGHRQCAVGARHAQR